MSEKNNVFLNDVMITNSVQHQKFTGKKQKQGKHGPVNQLEVRPGSMNKRPSSVNRSYPPCALCHNCSIPS